MRNQQSTIQINERSVIPKYRQLASELLRAIECGRIKKDELLPSIHQICSSVNISKVSVERAYQVLKEMGIVGSVKGKGFYLKRELGTVAELAGSAADFNRCMKDNEDLNFLSR